MTKQQAIRELVKLGWTDIVKDGKFCILATSAAGHRGKFDPKELLVELRQTLDLLPVDSIGQNAPPTR